MATPPARVSQDEIHAIEKDAAHNPASDAARQQTTGDLDASHALSTDANNHLQDFTRQAAITVAPLATPPADKPLEITPSPEDTHAECDDGLFFDSEKGILVYLKNVRLTDPRFTMTGADELKIFLEKKPAAKPDKSPTPAPDGKPDKSQPDLLGGASASFGDVEHIIANGRILVKHKSDDGKPPVEASAALLNYNAKTGEIILSGGYPWVRQGTTYLRALEPNLNIRIQKTGSFITSGHWDSGGKPKEGEQAAKPHPNKPKTPSH
jgi:hypothetical protein